MKDPGFNEEDGHVVQYKEHDFFGCEVLYVLESFARSAQC